ncbi:histone deacetylase superfamily [Thermodesulfatator indicus DSM 15286]|uniref:Histone deacetylase superfamily n=1 Tax=Thermodesulfatator indicus (strain DSM 15286 / JCM 11887 / CIR29812) TaxID=667014 RepID=F8ACC4_THEID|nr:histone deacetylase [Thermodesulfatator indicus]AEH45762.1 histone deacetylase superfamily [Thermodesulfatator indicus DSM 15286]
MNIAIVKDEIFLKHNPGEYHPERPERLEKIYSRLEKPDINNLYKILAPREATFEELTWNHSPEYVKTVQQTSGQSVQLDADTATSPESYEAAIKAVGAQFVGLDAIFSDQAKQVFALVRPPGHHAEYDRAMGFCLFNNVALAAHYALKKLGLKRILIVDWDLHHGNGTQKSFYHHREVLFFSSHQYPYYPGTGTVEEIGEGEGKGFTVNVPLPAGCGDLEYATVYRQILLPIAERFKPELVLVSAGFDIYFGDPLGGMQVTPIGVAYLARLVKQIADKHCNGRLLLTLEGGYSLQGLADSLAAVLFELAGRSLIPTDKLEEMEEKDREPEVLNYVKAVHKDFWPELA